MAVGIGQFSNLNEAVIGMRVGADQFLVALTTIDLTLEVVASITPCLADHVLSVIQSTHSKIIDSHCDSHV